MFHMSAPHIIYIPPGSPRRPWRGGRSTTRTACRRGRPRRGARLPWPPATANATGLGAFITITTTTTTTTITITIAIIVIHSYVLISPSLATCLYR